MVCQKGCDADVAQKDLKPVRTKEEAKERGRNGGIRSGEVRRAKKTMRETAKALMSMSVVGENNKRNLDAFGIDKSDQNYQTAVVVRLMQKALVEGDTSAIRLIGELTGDLNRFVPMDDVGTDIVECAYPSISLPDNGRDKRRTDELAPQAGPQTLFMASPADIVIYGGAAGGGKTYALLLEALRHKDVKGFGSVIFRHNYNQITAEGGLWDASQKIFNQVPDAHSRKSPKLHWRFDGGAKLNFAHIERDEDLKSWQGTEIAYIGFDELTHFTKHQFLYMLSRNRTTCGIRPYIRATCNPDADSWVADFISWWIDQDTGYPIPERSGQIRWMCVINDTIYFAGTREELAEEQGVDIDDCKSVTFIASRLEDNKVLIERDPGYLANLKALPTVEMERLLYGNWKIKPAAGLYFKRSQVGDFLEEVPEDVTIWARGWDLAATSEDEEGDPAYTAGVLIGKRKNGRYVVANVTNIRLAAADVRKHVKNTCMIDKQRYKRVTERLPQDPGQAGKEQAQSYIKMLSGYIVKAIAETGSKEARAEPFAAQWQAGNVDLVIGEWNESYLTQLESFPESKFKDMVDASSSAFAEIETRYAASPPPGIIDKESYWRR